MAFRGHPSDLQIGGTPGGRDVAGVTREDSILVTESVARTLARVAFLVVLLGVTACAGSGAEVGSSTVVAPTRTSGSAQTVPSTPAVNSPTAVAAAASPAIAPTLTGRPSPTSVPSPSAVGTTATTPSAAAVATPSDSASTTTAQPTSSQLELTSKDSGKTFVYGITTRFTIILDGQSDPKSDLTVSCDQSQVVGPISNLPSVAPPLYAVRYEGVNPGSCVIADRGFSVTIRIVDSPAPTPAAGQTPTAVAPAPAVGASPPGTSVGGSPPYRDDRSSAVDVVRSYYNAIDRHEYDRAYSYWEPSAAANQLPPYAQFKAGYADTGSVQLTIGDVRADAGAGQRYGSVPVALVSTLTNGSTRSYVGCYNLHLSVPSIQDQPPFQPWAIQGAVVQTLSAGADVSAALSTACAQNGVQPGVPVTPSPTASPDDIAASRYLDDRSTPEEVLRSLFNAVNRQEYDRAYSYWEPGAVGLPSYPRFKQGYQNTATVDLALGTVTTGMAAGNLYFQVPAVLVARQADGATQTFAACYTLHLGQPAIQDQPPFQPMAIQSATSTSVANGSNPSAFLAGACG